MTKPISTPPTPKTEIEVLRARLKAMARLCDERALEVFIARSELAALRRVQQESNHAK